MPADFGAVQRPTRTCATPVLFIHHLFEGTPPSVPMSNGGRPK